MSSASPISIALPYDLTPRKIADLLLESWRMGVKAVLLERKGLGSEPTEEDGTKETVLEETDPAPEAVTLPESGTDAAEPAPDDQVGGNGEHLEEEAVNASLETVREEVQAQGANVTSNGRTLPPLASPETEADREHARTLAAQDLVLESQLHRIAELEEQVATLQASARQSMDVPDAAEPARTQRHRLPAERASLTHSFTVAGHEGSITVGLYPNGSPGEVFLRMTKEPSIVSGMLDSLAAALSLGLQHGVPLGLLVSQFTDVRFEPAGETASEEIPYARSVVDYLFRWLDLRFLSGRQMDLFAQFAPGATDAIAITGTVTGEHARVVPHLRSATRREAVERS